MNDYSKLETVSSLFFYMWNMWSEEECMSISWTCNADHIWNKWSHFHYEYGPSGAIAPFYGELDDCNREVLVERATSRYRGHSEV